MCLAHLGLLSEYLVHYSLFLNNDGFWIMILCNRKAKDQIFAENTLKNKIDY